MPAWTAVSSDWAIVKPPSLLIALTPMAPSVSAPVRTMAIALVGGQRDHQPVDGHRPARPHLDRHRHQAPAVHLEVEAGRADVDMVGLDRGLGVDLNRRHARGLADQFGEPALVRGRQVHHGHEGAAAVGRHVREQTHHRLDPAGRGADGHREEGQRAARRCFFDRRGIDQRGRRAVRRQRVTRQSGVQGRDHGPS
jgi:hypothetical protein